MSDEHVFPVLNEYTKEPAYQDREVGAYHVRLLHLGALVDLYCQAGIGY